MRWETLPVMITGELTHTGVTTVTSMGATTSARRRQVPGRQMLRCALTRSGPGAVRQGPQRWGRLREDLCGPDLTRAAIIIKLVDGADVEPELLKRPAASVSPPA